MGQSPHRFWVITLSSAATARKLEISEDEWILIFTVKEYEVFIFSVENPREKIAWFLFFMYKKFKMLSMFTQRKLFGPGEGDTSLSF